MDRRGAGKQATYIHRLVVSRRYAGDRLGADLLTWAGAQAAQHYGARWIRLDAWTTNTALHTYYTGQGFEFVRYSAPANPSGALFQRAIRERTVSSAQIFNCQTTECSD